MNSITLSLIVCVIGALVYLVASYEAKLPTVAELGRLAFWSGLLAFLLGK